MQPDPDFDPTVAAKALLREARSGALATVMAADGHPYCSLVNVATDPDGAPVLLISGLAVHTRNIAMDPRASVMLDERKPGDPLEGARIMVQGRAERTDSDTTRRRYLARHPDAEMFVGFKDFAFYRIEPLGAHLVAGFGRIVDLKPAQFLTDLAGAADLVAAAAGAVEHMNADHAETLRLYAIALLRAPDGDWRCVGCDPDGLDLQHGRIGLRLPFPERVTSPGGLRVALKQLADKARRTSAG